MICMKHLLKYVCKPLSSFKPCVLSSSVFKENRYVFAFSTKTKKQFYQWEVPDGYDTGIKVLNSYGSLKQSKKKKLVPFVVGSKDIVKWFACGPTVYDSTHIGHASSYVRFDVIRRILEAYFDLNVFMVMGITDVDDKIINRAKLLGNEFLSLAVKYEREFQHDLNLLNVMPPTSYVKVSDIIPQIIAFTDELISKGNAYVGDDGTGNVWFKHSSISSVGHLVAGLDKWENADSNVTVLDKRHHQDFCLWKAAKPGEPYWEAPWGNGRPGWHIECSAASSLFFGDSLDIHTGGVDLSFPHHECEIKQCEAYHESLQWCNYFFHCGHLVKSGESQKMSKSLGGVITVTEFLNEYSSDHMRLLCINSPWHVTIHYSSDLMKEVDTQLMEIKQFMNRCQQFVLGNMSGKVDNENINLLVHRCQRNVFECFRQNFNTEQALNCLLYLQKQIDPLLGNHVLLDVWKPSDHLKSSESYCIGEMLNYLVKTYSFLGFNSLKPDTDFPC